MSEVTVTIFERSYRLAVSSGEEHLLEECARTVDEQMQAVRAAGRVIANDQIAVLTALELAYDARKRELAHEEEKAAAAVAAAAAQAAVSLPEEPEAVPQEPQRARSDAEDAEILEEIRSLCKLCEEALYRDAKMGSLF
ncbi:cell division protein ZapA [Sutterella sp.]|uniref:cell division protein ZapA n=1 Tax=Sutterella sp. TaxID=1981025 RepID=UPI0026DF54A4|nr:cell division protein ZapA [Sutterella sp.]MDO5532524.1 cell division protein ZapA [Sutterella sp.]